MFEMNRRTLLGGIGALGATTLLGGCGGGEAVEAPAQPFFTRIGKPIGLQTYTLGMEAGEDLEATFALIKEMGIGEIELPGLYGRTAEEVRAISDSVGLPIVSVHIPDNPRGPGLAFGNDISQVADAAETLGLTKVVIPSPNMPEGFTRNDGESFGDVMQRAFGEAGVAPWQAMAARFNEIGEVLAARGMTLGYHNHNLEFVPIGDTTGFGVLVAETDPDMVKFQLDLGWVAQAGLDPVAELTALSGRVMSVHVKDIAADSGQSYYMGMSPTEVGSGTIDWASVLPAAEAAGCEHYFVEQEPPFTTSRAEAVAKSAAYLQELVA